MIDAILRFSLQNRVFTFLLAGLLLLGGYFSFRSLTIEAFPDPTDTQVQIIALYPGQSSEEVERRVSLPLERALNGIPGMFRQRSISLFGLSYVTLSFEDYVDPWLARQQVMERLAGVELPPGVQPELGPMATPIGEVYRYTLRSEKHDPMQLRTLQDWVVAPRMRRVEGVADVMSYGGLQREIHVLPDPARMAELRVSLDELFEALEQASANATGGYVERGEEVLVIRSLGTFASMEDLGAVRIANAGGRPVKLREVATITEGWSPRQGIVTRGSEEDAVQGVVLMRKGENPSVVLASLREVVEELDTSLLPDGVEIDPFYDRTELVDRTLKTVFTNLAEGALLVVAVLLLFLLSLKASLIVALVIPLSLAAAFLYLQLRGMSANLLSMGAIDFGIIVDGSVIMVEHIFHRVSGQRRDLGGDSLSERILAAAKEVSRPTLFALLIIIAAYLPIFSLERVEGRMFGPMAVTVVSALVGAMVMTFTLVPVLCVFALRKPAPVRESPILRWSKRAFEPTLSWSMRNPIAVLVASAGVLGATLVLLPRLGTEFLPQLNEGSLYVTFTLPQNLSLAEGRKLVPQIREIFARTPEVDEILTQLGRPEDGTDPKLSNDLAAFLTLIPMEQWRPQMKKMDDLVEEMDRRLKEIPGIEFNFSQPILDNVAENISGQSGAVAVKFHGEDLDELRELAEQARRIISEVPGSADVALVRAGVTPQIVVHPDREALARYDLDLADVQEYVETALAGRVANELWEGEWRFDVAVRLPFASREDVDAIRGLPIPLPEGGVVPLAALAEVREESGRAAITRENGSRYVGVRTNVRDRDLGSFVAEARARFDEELRLPTGYGATWGGEFENQQRAMARLQMVIPLALLLTFALLYSAFRSVWDATLILLNLPLALVGGVLALAVAKLALSVSAAVGFIALIGQAVLNGVLVVSAIRTRLSAGEDLHASVVGGTHDRLRAVLMTALLASLGLVPAALSTAIGSETQRPIAVVIVGGTFSAALLTLVVLPVTYYWGSRLRDRLLRKPEAPSAVLSA